MEHSVRYYSWMKTISKAQENVKQFKKDGGSLSDFTKADILGLLGSHYQYYVEIYLLKDNADFIVSIFHDEELKAFMKKTSLKDELFLELLNHYTDKKPLLKELFLDDYFHRFFILYYKEIIACQKLAHETHFLDFLLPSVITMILSDENQKYYQELILNDILSSEFYMELIFQTISLECLKGLSLLKSSPYYEQFYQKYKVRIFKLIFHNAYFWGITFILNSDNRDLFETVLLIIEDTCRLAGKDISDFKYFDAGGYCDVYQIGDYVLKMGRQRCSNEIPFDEDVLYPICRKYIPLFDLFLEVSFLGDNRNVSDEDVYQIFKRKREQGKIWVDARVQNIVRLKKDNGDYPFEVEPWTLGFFGEAESVRRKIGECVICDTDSLCYYEDFNFEEVQNTYSNVVVENLNKFESRYKRELKRKRT